MADSGGEGARPGPGVAAVAGRPAVAEARVNPLTPETATETGINSSPAGETPVTRETAQVISDLAGQALKPNGDTRGALNAIVAHIRFLKTGNKEGVSREMAIELQERKMQAAIEDLKKSKKPRDRALGHDLDIAFSKIKLQEKRNRAEQDNEVKKAKLEDTSVPDEEKARIKAELELVEEPFKAEDKRIVDMKRARDEAPGDKGKTLTDEPNQIDLLAKKLGMSDEQIAEGAFYKILDKIWMKAQEKPADRRAFMAHLKKNGFSNAELKDMDKAMGMIRGDMTPGEKAKATLLNSTLGSLIGLAILMMNAKEKKQGMG